MLMESKCITPETLMALLMQHSKVRYPSLIFQHLQPQPFLYEIVALHNWCESNETFTQGFLYVDECTLHLSFQKKATNSKFKLPIPIISLTIFFYVAELTHFDGRPVKLELKVGIKNFDHFMEVPFWGVISGGQTNSYSLLPRSIWLGAGTSSFTTLNVA